MRRSFLAITAAVGVCLAGPMAQQASPPAAGPPPQDATAGRGRGGPPVQGAEEDLPLVAKFDRNADKRLDFAERTAARAYLIANPEVRRPLPSPRIAKIGTAGPSLSAKDVKQYDEKTSLYDPDALRTLFLEFERPDWEQELAAFYHTDVDIPAALVVDGTRYRDVGVSFRGNNSYTAVPEGLKRPLTIKLDFVHNDQHLLGYRTLQLLNSNQDPTFLRTLLFLDAARDYMPAQRANFVRVAINGESWGIYVNQQAFNKDFLKDAFKTTDGLRFKSPNNSTGGGLSYLGEDVAPYRRWYEIKSKDDAASWAALIRLCQVLNQTPLDQLEHALRAVMDVDSVLKYLALDVALVNNDGYWRDGSDFNLYRDTKGQFHLVPHDVNEGFRASGRDGGASPDPLVALDDPNKSLRHRLLAVPALRTRYLAYVGDIAEKWLDWSRLGPLVERYQSVIAGDVERDTRKLDSTEAFKTGVYGASGEAAPAATTIKGFADQRRAALLAHPEIVNARQRSPRR